MSGVVLVLGGYGHVGRVAAPLLLEHTDAEVIVAGRSREKAETFAAGLAGRFPGRAGARVADATDEPSLRAALAGVGLLFDCGPTSLFTERLVRTVLASGVDCLDVHPSRSLAVLAPLAPAIERAGRCFVTQAGLHPGLPATILRHVASLLEHCDIAHAGMLFNVGRVADPDSVIELIEEMSAYKSLLWQDGAWRKPSWTYSRRLGFGPDFGARTCYPMWSDELKDLPERLGVRELGFHVAGLNWFADYVVTPLALALGSIRRGLGARPLAKMLVFGIEHFARRPFAIVLVGEASGERHPGSRRARLIVRSDDDDGYRLTAIPAVACVKQLLDGSARQPGLHLMGHLVEPARLIEDMGRMGVGVTVTVDPGKAGGVA